MYSLVVSYKVKLHMHALYIFMILCRIIYYYNDSNKHNILVYSKCSMSFILYILTILVYQDVVISGHVSAVIMEFKKKTFMVIIHGK